MARMTAGIAEKGKLRDLDIDIATKHITQTIAFIAKHLVEQTPGLNPRNDSRACSTHHATE